MILLYDIVVPEDSHGGCLSLGGLSSEGFVLEVLDSNGFRFDSEGSSPDGVAPEVAEDAVSDLIFAVSDFI